jgi:hypothetical protein
VFYEVETTVREYPNPNPKFRVPEVSGIVKPVVISGIDSQTRNFKYPNYPTRNFRVTRTPTPTCRCGESATPPQNDDGETTIGVG